MDNANPVRYFLDQDNDCHWYIVPDASRAEWDAWRSLDGDDEASWEVPDYAKRLACCPSRVTFELPTGEFHES